MFFYKKHQQYIKKGKKERDDRVEKTHDIVLFFGYNLSDFPGFKEKSLKDRNQVVEDLNDEFGDKFIIFPNPMYGGRRMHYMIFKTRVINKKRSYVKTNFTIL